MNHTWMIWEEINSLVAKNTDVFVWKLIKKTFLELHVLEEDEIRLLFICTDSFSAIAAST